MCRSDQPSSLIPSLIVSLSVSLSVSLIYPESCRAPAVDQLPQERRREAARHDAPLDALGQVTQLLEQPSWDELDQLLSIGRQRTTWSALGFGIGLALG